MTATQLVAERGIRAIQPERNCLVRKLSGPADLSDEDKQAIADLCREVRTVPAKRHIIREGDNPSHVHVIMEGWAARYVIMDDGGRQIVAFLLPGDFCDAHIQILSEMDHGIIAVTEVKVAYVGHEAIEALPRQRPQLGLALWWATLVDEAVLRQWIANIGRRGAEKRVAHLFCELHARMKLVGLVDDDQLRLPLSQEMIADTLGLTPVHVNRMLKSLKSKGLVSLSGGELLILDLIGLQKLAGFDPNYLHRGRLARSR